MSIIFKLQLYSEHSPIVENANSSVVIVRTSEGSSCSEGSGATSVEMSEDPKTPPPQEAMNPPQKVIFNEVKRKEINRFDKLF